jgi:GNAT superfamily N-acetyltransferase
MTTIIRGYRPADLTPIYEICLLVGDNGEDATPLYRERSILGDLYAGAYGLLSPEFALWPRTRKASVDLRSAFSTRPPSKRLEEEWWPALRQRYRDPRDIPVAKRSADERAANLIHHPPRAPSDLLAAYPSHLHIDVLPRQQGQGLGGRLMQSLLDALRQAGSPGVHLVVSAGNPRAIGFYHHQGFRLLSDGQAALTLGKPL